MEFTENKDDYRITCNNSIIEVFDFFNSYHSKFMIESAPIYLTMLDDIMNGKLNLIVRDCAIPTGDWASNSNYIKKNYFQHDTSYNGNWVKTGRVSNLYNFAVKVFDKYGITNHDWTSYTKDDIKKMPLSRIKALLQMIKTSELYSDSDT